MQFCRICDGRLVDETSTTELYYVCARCNKKYPSQPKDTLRFRQVFNKKKENVQYDVLISNAPHDITNPREYYPCPKCNRQITSYVVVGDNMVFIHVCQCGHRF
jgi:DNA-directed RNA polymerase subunit M/transcription elongation factor TFIIS